MSLERFDPGLQPERTELAWRRTSLAVTVGALVALRLLPPILGSWSISVGLVGLVMAVLIWVLAHRRARHTNQALRHERGQLPGAGLLLLLAGVTTAGAAFGLLYVALRRATARRQFVEKALQDTTNSSSAAIYLGRRCSLEMIKTVVR